MVLTARHCRSKESFATTYWTLIGPTLLNSSFRAAHQCLTSSPRTTILTNFRFADDPEANGHNANAKDDWHSLEAQAPAIAIQFLKLTM
jgi:hypothetical protein